MSPEQRKELDLIIKDHKQSHPTFANPAWLSERVQAGALTQGRQPSKAVARLCGSECPLKLFPSPRAAIPLSADCVEKLDVGRISGRSESRAGVVASAARWSDRGDWLRDRDELGELPEVLGGRGEQEFISGAARPA